MIGELFTKPFLIFGCGNILFGDDGFGPEVVERLGRHHELPHHVLAVDVGTGIRNFLFDLLLAPTKPERIIVVDAVSQAERRPGELFELAVEDLPACKVNDFSLHQFPSVNLLLELERLAGVRVQVLAVQAGSIPDRVRPGLSPEVREAVPRACGWLIRSIEGRA